MERAKFTDLIVFYLVAFLLSVDLAGSSLAQTTTFTYQGKLTDAGNPANGNYDIELKLFDALSGGAQQGSTITNPTVQVTNGNFTIPLDFGINVFTGAVRYLEISVRPAGSPNPYTVLAPRQQITSSPYAIQTLNAAQLGGLPASRYVSSNSNGNVGIGTTTPAYPLDVAGSIRSLSNSFALIYAQTTNTFDGAGFWVQTPDQAWLLGSTNNLNGNEFYIYDATNGQYRMTIQPVSGLVRFPNSSGGRILIGDAGCGGGFGGIGFAPTLSGCANYALLGDATNTFFNRPAGGGLYFREANSDQMAITTGGNVGIGTITPQSKLEVQTSNFSYGFSHTNGTVTVSSYVDGTGGWLGTRNNHPLYFFSNGGLPQMTVHPNGGVGIGTVPTQAKLHVNGSSLNGVYASSSFKGVWGESDGTNGSGVHGIGSGSGGYGIYGLATGGSNSTGVFGESQSSQGFGVFGRAPNWAIWGKTTDGGRGLYGDNNGSDSVGYAGYFFGRVNVTGLLSKGAGAFKIDHPLDPENKYLLHSFVESPDMMNIYNGNVITDEQGFATVTMPDWFEALNQDFRYQLTVIGQFAQAIIASKLQKNRFIIQTDKPQVEVSWQVTGIRHDAYARANRIPVEQEKPKNEVGYYLHPQAFGRPEEKGVEWAQHRNCCGN